MIKLKTGKKLHTIKMICQEVLTELEKVTKKGEVIYSQSWDSSSGLATLQNSEKTEYKDNYTDRSNDITAEIRQSTHANNTHALEEETNTTNNKHQTDAKYQTKKTIYIKEMTAKTREQLLLHQKRKISNPSESSIDYSIGLWDYGGHTEFLSTHQLFLNIESTILILLDMSKPLKEIINKDIGLDTKPEVPVKAIDFLNYWLAAIHSQAIEKKCHPNIALVLTHKDMIKEKNTNQYIQEYIDEVLTTIRKKPYSKYIKAENIFPIDNINGEETDFIDL